MGTTTTFPAPETAPERPTPAGRNKGRPVCRHCGASSPHGEFCCAGCAYVYRLINDEGLAGYYRVKDAVTPPADVALMPARSYEWLEQAKTEAERRAASHPELQLDIQGLSCAGCVWLVERLFQKQPGARLIEINAPTGQLRLSWDAGQFDAAAFGRTLQSFNYLLAPFSSESARPPESRGLVTRIGLCAAFAMNVMLFTLPTYFGMAATGPYAKFFSTLSLAFGSLSLLAGGGYFISRAWRSMAAGVATIDLPIALGIIGAYAGSIYGWFIGADDFVYFDFVSTFILLMLVGRWAQTAAVERNRRRLLAQQPTPSTVRVVDESGTETRCPRESLRAGQRFLIAPGEIVPVLARLESTNANFSLSWINGESEPRDFNRGHFVPAGAVNITRDELIFVAAQAWPESLLASLLKPVEYENHRHILIERVVRGYLFAIIGAALISGIAWWWSTGNGLKAGAVVTAVLVVSCPCALGLAFPLTEEIAVVALRRRGVFVRKSDLWPRLDRVRLLAFDKTGTLTLETPVLRNPEALATLEPQARAALLSLVQDNLHPTARCLHEHLLSDSPPAAFQGEWHEEVGFGVALAADGHRWSLGRANWRDLPREAGSKEVGPDGQLSQAESEFSRDGQPIASFYFNEEARDDAREELSALQKRGLSIAILSGDRSAKVLALTQSLGLPDGAAFGDLTPADKAAWLDRQDRNSALMLGDGANDSLAFDRALCRGTPVVHRGVLESKADFYYLGRGIAGLRALFEVNDARRRTQRLLLVFMILYNCVAVGLSVAGQMNPLLAAILMPVSSLVTLALVGVGMKELCKSDRGEAKLPARE